MARRAPRSRRSRRPATGPVRRAAVYGARARRFDRPSTRTADWRTPVDGRAPRLGARQYIGHDIAEGRGAWKGRDPMRTPTWWNVLRWLAVVYWATATAGAGFLSWRRHGGKAFLFGRDDEADGVS